MEKLADISKLVVPNSLSYLSAIQSYSSEVAVKLGFQKNDVEKIMLALEEAVVNVVKHSFEPGERATYEIIFECMTTGLKIRIKDKGLPFASSIVPEYSAPADIDSTPVSGLGSFLMKKSVDEVVFQNLGREGKEFQLIKYLPYKNIVDYQGVSEMEMYPAPGARKEEPFRKKAYIVRLMELSESFEVSKLFYRAYGYSYSIDSIYYPDKFAQLIKDGLVISVVTVTEDNRIVGHLALVKDHPSDRIAEAAMAVVEPDFRGQGCQNRMMARLIEESKRVGLFGVHSKAVTAHPYAQKAGQKAGFKRVALAVGVIPADRVYKGMEVVSSQRGSVAYGYLPILNPTGIKLYPPEHHKPFVEKIYQNVGLQRTFVHSAPSFSDSRLEETSLVKTTISYGYNKAAIEIERYGRNIVEEIKMTLRELCIKKIEEMTLNLRLEDPLTAVYCSRFEEMGFFIAGILPFYHFGDTLILQYLNNIVVDYHKIAVASEALEEIRAYVKARDPNLR